MHGAVIATAVSYVLLPLNASAANLSICPSSGAPDCVSFVNTYVQPIITLLTILIGVFGVISIIIAGIQYSSAGDDSSKVNKAKNRIFQTIIGLLAYFFLYSLLNFFIPGGLF